MRVLPCSKRPRTDDGGDELAPLVVGQLVRHRFPGYGLHEGAVVGPGPRGRVLVRWTTDDDAVAAHSRARVIAWAVSSPSANGASAAPAAAVAPVSAPAPAAVPAPEPGAPAPLMSEERAHAAMYRFLQAYQSLLRNC